MHINNFKNVKNPKLQYFKTRQHLKYKTSAATNTILRKFYKLVQIHVQLKKHEANKCTRTLEISAQFYFKCNVSEFYIGYMSIWSEITGKFTRTQFIEVDWNVVGSDRTVEPSLDVRQELLPFERAAFVVLEIHETQNVSFQSKSDKKLIFRKISYKNQSNITTVEMLKCRFSNFD